MTALLTRASIEATGITRSDVASALGCCLTRMRVGVYVVHSQCGTDAHARIREIATPAPLASEGDIHLAGLRGHTARVSCLIDSYRDSLPTDAAFSHLSAALLWGLPITRDVQARAEVIRPARARTHDQIMARKRPLAGDHVTHIDGTRLTTVTQTAVDVAHDYPLDVSVPIIDAALRSALLTLTDLTQGLEPTPARRGVRRARHALTIADPAHESPAESICAVRFHEHGIDGFVPQVTFGSPDGAFRARVDFLHREAKLIVEVNGEIKYADGDTGRRRARHERDRENHLRNMGYRVFQLSWSDLFAPGYFHQIKQSIAAAAKPDPRRTT